MRGMKRNSSSKPPEVRKKKRDEVTEPSTLLERSEIDVKICEKLDQRQRGSMAIATVIHAFAKFKKLLLMKRQVSTTLTEGHTDDTRESRKKKRDSIKDGKILLSQRLDFMSLSSTKMPSDGNCQFRAFSCEAYGTEEYHLNIRANVVEWMLDHKETFSCYVGEDSDWNYYIKRMKRSRIWGDELTLRAFCDCYKVTVHVITTERENYNIQYTPSTASDGPIRSVFLSYISPVHYDVITQSPAP